MNVRFHRRFSKSYKRAPTKLRESLKVRLVLFCENPFHPLLNNHALHGALSGYRSINVTGNVRAIYKTVAEDTVEFVLLGTHSSLYGK